MAILSEANIIPFKDIDKTAQGKGASISALIATLRRLYACVVLIQSCTPEQNAYDLYVATCMRKRGVLGGIPSHFGKGGRLDLYDGAIGVG